MLNRRQFVSAAARPLAAGVVAAAFLDGGGARRALAAVAGRSGTPEELAGDEGYWFEVQQGLWPLMAAPPEMDGDVRKFEEIRILVTPIVHPEFRGLRVTPSVYTTLEEVDRFAEAIEAVLDRGLPA